MISRLSYACRKASLGRGASLTLSRPVQNLKMSSNAKKVSETVVEAAVQKAACGDLSEEAEEDEMEEMFVQGPAGIEWGGPTRGGNRPEPTRFGDWERKGRCSDF